jgi:two-component system response regulator YesN
MSYKMLICDDERRIREGVRQAVDWASIGIDTVETAADGEEGWAWVCDHRPEVVLTDIRMPKMDGLAFLNKIMVAFPYTKVILLTGYEDFSYAQQAIRSRAYDYVMKPTNPDTLLRTCKSALEDRAANVKRTVLMEPFQDEPDLLAEQIIRYVQDHYMDTISLETAAKEIHMSTVHLNRIMKKDMGTTFLEYLTHVRIEEAKRLLQKTKKTVHEICFDIGYNDPKYFSQLFRKMTGSKPSEFAVELRSRES